METATKAESIKSLDRLILEGINITKNAQEGDALYSTNSFIAVDLHQKYILWVMDIKDLFERHEYNRSESSHYWIVKKFLIGDSVPILKGGIEYGDPGSEKSQILLKSIREESTKKVGHLQELKDILFEKKRNTKVVSNADIKALTAEMTLGDLVSYNDGSIRYKKEVLNLRPRAKDLCRILMKRPNSLITVDDIKEEIVDAKKRKSTPTNTISKYVSELHKVLRTYYQKDVIFNTPKEGWRFKI